MDIEVQFALMESSKAVTTKDDPAQINPQDVMPSLLLDAPIRRETVSALLWQDRLCQGHLAYPFLAFGGFGIFLRCPVFHGYGREGQS